MGKRSKYKVDMSNSAKKKRTVHDEHTGKDITFDSAIEKRYYDEVVLPGFLSGEIVDYDLQRRYTLLPSFRRENGELVRAITYIADYVLKFADGHEEIKDTKGAGYLVDPLARIKRKLFYHAFPDLDLEWITWTKATGWVNWDDFMKNKRNKRK